VKKDIQLQATTSGLCVNQRPLINNLQDVNVQWAISVTTTNNYHH